MGIGVRRLRFIALAIAACLPFVMLAAGAQELLPASYSVSASPDTCEAEVDCVLTFTFTNSSPPGSAFLLDTATIAAPDNFVVTAVGDVTTSPVPKSWNSEVNDNQNQVTLTAANPGSALLPTERLSVDVTVVASLLALGPDREFKTTASGTNPIEEGGQPFSRIGSNPKVDVVSDQVACHPGQTCETSTVTLNNTSGQASASSGGTEAVLRISVGGSWELNSDGCSLDVFIPKGEVVTTDVNAEDRSHLVTVTLNKKTGGGNNGPGAAHFEICLAADTQFTTKSGLPAQPNSAGFYEGILPKCPTVIVNAPSTKCLMSRDRDVDGNTVIKYFIGAGDPFGIPGLDG